MVQKYRESPRKRLRFKGYDYGKPGHYFVTFCTENRLCLFGKVKNKQMILNSAGRMIHKTIQHLSHSIQSVCVDHFIVMPNHVHAIIILNTQEKKLNVSQKTLPNIIKSIKNYTTYQYTKGVRQKIYEPFFNSLWQRSYHDHIIRNADSLNRIRQYIDKNPENWDQDKCR